METYNFRVVITGHENPTEEMANAIFEAGVDDGSLGRCGNVVSVDIDREASDLGQAITSACQQIRSAGYPISGVEIGSASVDQLLSKV